MGRTAIRRFPVPLSPLPDSASQIATLLGGALLRPLPSGRFAVTGDTPAWFTTLWPGLDDTRADLRAVSLFLDAFLADADDFWLGHAPGPLASGVWTETAPDGSEVILEALALRLDSGPLLLLRPPAIPFDAYRHALQQSREQALAFEALRRDFQQHEDAISCLLHDLGTPLASLRASLEFLRQDGFVAEPGLELHSIAQSQVDRMQAYVRGFLDAVLAQQRPPAPLDGPFPDVREAVKAMLASFGATARQKNVHLLFEDHTDATTAPLVVGERVRLERVVANLLDNALRHTPPGSTVRMALNTLPHRICLTVTDEGMGVPEAFRPMLFRRFSRGPGASGAAGLGLYFCRTTIESWGGSIVHLPSPEGGAAFRCCWARPTLAVASLPSEPV
ncbi:MAG: HAMP domain-containing histidine kinase [Rhodothermales bacterium]|nr:HAMP domain-containing histidine kinase [Rhodothermales bacterium]MCA0270123.1 HAMP domain-containing histidine kinase [Bacteroidota bacterium]